MPQTPIFENEAALIPRVINRSDFDIIFNKLYPEIENYRWIIKGSPQFQFPEEWFINAWYDEEEDMERSPQLDEYASYIISTNNDSFLAKAGFVSKYLKYLRDDWLDIYALPGSFTDLDGFIKSYWHFKNENDRNHWLSETVDICIFNIDGMFWEFYSKYEHHLKILSDHAKTIPEFKAINCTLLDKRV